MNTLIYFHCEYCGKKSKTFDYNIGKYVQCPFCNKPTIVVLYDNIIQPQSLNYQVTHQKPINAPQSHRYFHKPVYTKSSFLKKYKTFIIISSVILVLLIGWILYRYIFSIERIVDDYAKLGFADRSYIEMGKYKHNYDVIYFSQFYDRNVVLSKLPSPDLITSYKEFADAFVKHLDIIRVSPFGDLVYWYKRYDGDIYVSVSKPWKTTGGSYICVVYSVTIFYI